MESNNALVPSQGSGSRAYCDGFGVSLGSNKPLGASA